MGATGRLVLDRPSSRSSQLEPQLAWGCEPSTSYSTRGIFFQRQSVRMPSRQAVHLLSFSMLPEEHNHKLLSSRHSAAPNHHVQQHHPQRQNAVTAMGSISLSLADMLQPKASSRRKARRQSVSLETSGLQPSASLGQHSIAQSSSDMLHSHQSYTSPSVSMVCFQLPDRGTAHSQQPLFASLSSTTGCRMRKRKSVSIASDTAASSAVRLSPMHTTSRRGPIVELAQNSVQTLGTQAHELVDDGADNIAAAGHRLRKSALNLPSQLRRLLAGAFAGQPLHSFCISQNYLIDALFLVVTLSNKYLQVHHTDNIPILHTALALLLCL